MSPKNSKHLDQVEVAAVVAMWVVVALGVAALNLVSAFSGGPDYFGWEFPDGLSGFLGAFCLMLAAKFWRGER